MIFEENSTNSLFSRKKSDLFVDLTRDRYRSRSRTLLRPVAINSQPVNGK